MTANEIRYAILLAMDSLFEGTAPGYDDAQLNSIINRAQRRVFREKVKLFDTSETIKRMLAPLLVRASYKKSTINLTTEATITDYKHTTPDLDTTFFTLPSNMGYIKEEMAILSLSAVEQDPSIVLPITFDYFTKNYKNRYKKPHVKLIWRMDAKLESSRHCVELIYPDDYTIADYLVSYIRYPASIVVDSSGGAPSMVNCEITDVSFHDEIVGESVKIITAALGDGDYQTAAVEKKFDE